MLLQYRCCMNHYFSSTCNSVYNIQITKTTSIKTTPSQLINIHYFAIVSVNSNESAANYFY